MTVFPFILDSRLQFLRDGGAAEATVGLLPYGRRTILEFLETVCFRATRHVPRILTTFEPAADYAAAVRARIGRQPTIAGIAELGRRLAELEPSDWVLLVDPRCFPRGSVDFRPFWDGPTSALARHLVCMKRSPTGTSERLQFDEQGNMRRIQRYYVGATDVATAGIAASLVSAACADKLTGREITSLAQVREILTGCGVPSSDLPSGSGAIDLRTAAGVLKLNEQACRRDLALPGKRRGSRPAPRAHRGPGSTVDASARLLGPVILHADAVVDAGATVIGPTVIGPNARVGRNAVLAHSLVLPGAAVPAGATVCRRVVSAEGAAADEARQAAQLSETHGDGEADLSDHALPHDIPSEDARRVYLKVKRGLDATIAALGLIGLMPLLLLVAALVKLTSKGPVLFAHEREGRFGKVFRCYKFRSMIVDADARQRELYAKNQVDGPQFKMARDPRVTWLGHWLRKTNIDELPQLINVLRGEMSLIGPRPSPFRENQVCVPWRNARLSVWPGITGLWQVCRGDRSGGDFHQWIHFDTLYVRHFTFALDMKILLATLVTLGGRFSVPVSWLLPREKADSETVRYEPVRLERSAKQLAGLTGRENPVRVSTP